MNNIFGLKAICYEQANPNGHNGVECALSDTQDCCLSLLLYRFTLGAADSIAKTSSHLAFRFNLISLPMPLISSNQQQRSLPCMREILRRAMQLGHRCLFEFDSQSVPTTSGH
ncbi:predicted protein [Lichtheimia corymbifera JMRC:FSU:9682]|uniref:Uncharacterized protein n=1 Tax=Lichtheimia corymbifera JMRC:FSU:9682 TaxID=1263082 RepID=A0A068RQ20_9FUNG|nr:predicted protein [Lichtheimia corymbifera JMRC:FSU:9682]